MSTDLSGSDWLEVDVTALATASGAGFWDGPAVSSWRGQPVEMTTAAMSAAAATTDFFNTHIR
ncbi:MAG TPA: hypothetical protein VG056_02655, partial [Pirellulales bacterium]|nr:hypothetical protein [Pirellulales bacterium]